MAEVFPFKPTDRDGLPPARLPSDGGDGTFDGMEARVKALEDDMKKILQDTAEIKGMLRTAPSAVDFGELKGRVNALPTTAKVASIVAIVGVIVTIALRWGDLMALIPHK
jgi:hypothetical protein